MVDINTLSNRPRSRFSYRTLLAPLVARPWAGLLATAILTAVLAWQLPGLRFRTSIYDLVIEDLPDTVRYERFKEVFGSEEIIRVVIKADGDVFRPAAFQAIERLSDAAAGIQGVRRVISLPEIRRSVDLSAKLTLPEFAAMIAPVRLFHKNLVSDDRNSTVLTLLLENTAEREAITAAVRELIAREPDFLSLYQIGMPLVAEALASYTQTDFLRLPPVTLAIIFIILLLLFNPFVAVVTPLVCVGLTLVWTFGLMAWTDTHLSMLTMIIPVFLIAVGTAYCLHVVAEYVACAQRLPSRKNAVHAALETVSLPTVLAVSTTAVGLGSLFVNRIASIREFALFSCVGLLCLLAAILFFLPSFLMVLPLPKSRQPLLRHGRILDSVLAAIVRLSQRHQRAALGTIAAVSLVSAMGLAFLRVETNPVDQFRRDTPISRHFHDIYRDLSGSFPANVVLDGRMESYFEKPASLRQLTELQGFLETLPGVDKTISVADYMMLVNYALNRYDPAAYALPQEDFEVRMVLNNYKNLLGGEMLSNFMTADFSKANILLLTHLSSSAEFLQLKDRVLEYFHDRLPPDIDGEVTGFGVVIAASSHLLTLGQVKSFSLTVVFIFVLMTVLFLSTKVGLIATLPNVFPILAVFGFMGWVGIRLSMVTSLIASIAIGLAVDDTIHYLVRYHREFKRDLNKDRALRDTVRGVGRPIILTTLVISAGFSVLVFSHFIPTATFGLLMVVTMLAALVGDLILLPALLLHVELVTAWDLLRRMPALEGMTAAAAHELRQPLNAIRMGSDYLDVMLQRGGAIPSDALARVSAEIGLQVDRATAIIHRLSMFGQHPETDPGPVNVNQTVSDAVEVVSSQLRLENITLALDLAEHLPPVEAHSHRLGQVILNLLANAMEAIDKKTPAGDGREAGKIVVRSRVDGGWVVFEVEDSGTGIPAFYLERVMEPFFTTKELPAGKGLGLSVCRQIVKGYGGSIRVRNRAGGGAVVEVRLPRFTEGNMDASGRVRDTARSGHVRHHSKGAAET